MVKHRSSQFDGEIGRRVRFRRLDLGISQTDLADFLGITFQQVQKYENGTNRISASRLKQIAEKLKVRMDYFYDDAIDGSAESQTVFKFLQNAYSLRLLRSFSRIHNKQMQLSIVEMVERVAETQKLEKRNS
jgi:transcriptional regulator with XRE-family HTH domain